MQLPGSVIPCDAPETLLILLHGYGASGKDLLSCAHHLGKTVKGLYSWLPDGPEPCEQYVQGRQWFSLEDIDFNRPLLQDIRRRLDKASDHIADCLDRSPFKGKIFIGGFSQGASLAIHIGLNLMPVQGILGFSGFYPIESLKTSPPRYKPPLFWYHGALDTVVPMPNMNFPEFQACHIPITPFISQQAEHWITSQGMDAAYTFLKQCLHSVKDDATTKK